MTPSEVPQNSAAAASSPGTLQAFGATSRTADGGDIADPLSAGSTKPYAEQCKIQHQKVDNVYPHAHTGAQALTAAAAWIRKFTSATSQHRAQKTAHATAEPKSQPWSHDTRIPLILVPSMML